METSGFLEDGVFVFSSDGVLLSWLRRPKSTALFDERADWDESALPSLCALSGGALSGLYGISDMGTNQQRTI